MGRVLYITFDESSTNFDGCHAYDYAFVKGIENYLNSLIKVKGYVTGVDIYNNLGIPIPKDQYIKLASYRWNHDVNFDIDDKVGGELLIGTAYDDVDTEELRSVLESLLKTL